MSRAFLTALFFIGCASQLTACAAELEVAALPLASPPDARCDPDGPWPEDDLEPRARRRPLVLMPHPCGPGGGDGEIVTCSGSRVDGDSWYSSRSRVTYRGRRITQRSTWDGTTIIDLDEHGGRRRIAYDRDGDGHAEWITHVSTEYDGAGRPVLIRIGAPGEDATRLRRVTYGADRAVLEEVDERADGEVDYTFETRLEGGGVVTEIRGPDGVEYTRRCDRPPEGPGVAICEVDDDGDGELDTRTTRRFDAGGRVVEILVDEAPFGGEPDRRSRVQLDANGYVIREERAVLSRRVRRGRRGEPPTVERLATPEVDVTRFVRDARGRILRQEEYDPLGELTSFRESRHTCD